ncbi:MAG: hypothetical protein J6S82_03025 [Bacteroidales bacterium]|nr:hypothetical protein [Bacteroidales bacterium]
MFHGSGIEVIQIDIYYNASQPELLRGKGANAFFAEMPNFAILSIFGEIHPSPNSSMELMKASYLLSTNLIMQNELCNFNNSNCIMAYIIIYQ